MLPPELNLEIRCRLPVAGARSRTSRPPLLFVHGGYCDGWCWEPYFLPYFAAQGFASHALSLRGHGASGGHETLFVASIDDYANDVLQVMATLPEPPVLIGHSMGAAIIERIQATQPIRAAALLAPVSPSGLLPIAARLATRHPEFLLPIASSDPMELEDHVMDALRPFYFSPDVEPAILLESIAHFGKESTRALIDMSLRLHWDLLRHTDAPLLVMGAEGDQVCTPDEVVATARHHGVEPTLLPGLAHVMMLERGWEAPARAIRDWLATI